MIEIREAKSDELEELYKLRWKINRKPFGLPKGTEIDDKEESSIKIIAYDNDNKKIVGSARLFIHMFDSKVTFVGVDQEYRNSGIGSQIMNYIKKVCIENNVKVIRLSSRKSAQGFYEKLGYDSLEEYYVNSPYCQFEVEMELKL